MTIPNYLILEQLGESSQFIIFKAIHKKNPDRLLSIKVFKSSLLPAHFKTGFKQRIEHLKILNDPLSITPISFEEKIGKYIIIQDYFEGISLDAWASKKVTLSLKEFFLIACKLAQALEKIHDSGIVHGGIKPHNILIKPDVLDIRIIDFITSIDIREISHFIYDKAFIKDTLAYTSPEQTGRINHRVSFSSDLYSLGIVFFELLTGQMPFFSYDPLELIHLHLAKEMPDVRESYPDIPVTLGNIVKKLTVKQPEKRYQSGGELLADLIRCRDEYSVTGVVSEFPLATHISSDRVTFISKMVGRENEAGVILDEYEQVVKSSFRSVFISGLPGIGKTRLIQELQKPIVKHKGYFTSGKFDVYQKNSPYSALIQALRNLIITFLTESNERVGLWRNRICEALGDNGRIIVDVIPELEILIGSQPEVQALPPIEAINRFHDVFDRFLNCLATAENPLTLFIDDLQWCDTASFDFLANIFANCQEHSYLFFLGAYRHNEVDSSHPLAKFIQNSKQKNHPLKEIKLGPLKPQHCHEMVSYILDSPLDQTVNLSDFINELTEGNPLFVNESLSYLHNQNLIFLDDDRQWFWDLDKIRQSNMPTTVVDLFTAKIQRLSSDLIELLEYCACIGNIFSPDDIALIRGITLLDTFKILKPALGQRLLVENKGFLQFIHDRVQEAVLRSLPPEKLCQIHSRIGNSLLYAIPKGTDIAKVENLFTIVSHLNLGREKNLDDHRAYSLSDLNYLAGNKALDSLAIEAANEYFNISRELLPKDCWDAQDEHRHAQYKKCFNIFKHSAKTELMCGNYKNSEKLLEQLLSNAKTNLDKAECLAEQTTTLSSVGNFIKAIETANIGLNYFKKAIPDDPEEVILKKEKLMKGISSQHIDVWNTIRNMPFTTNRKNKIELAFYSELIPDLYMSGLVPQLYLAAVQSTQHCLSGGMDESVIYSFSIMGLQLGEQEEFELAFKYEDLARDLSAKYPNTFGATRGMNGIVWCNMHSRSHPKEIVDYCLKSIECGKNCGDLYNAGLSYGPLMWNLQVNGENFSAIEEYAKECLQFSNRYHLSFSIGLAEAMIAGWIEPMKKGYVPVSMKEKAQQWQKDNHIASAGSYYVHRALSCYYFGEYEEADHSLQEVKRYLTGLTDNVLKRQFYVFQVLNALKLYEKGSSFKSERELLREIQPLIAKVETWARLGPLLKPYLAFIYAELRRVIGNSIESINLYLDAIKTAAEQGYLFLEGHLNECLGELLINEKKGSVKIHLKEAARLYRACHAERKEIQLVEKYSSYFDEEIVENAVPVSDVDASYILPDLDVDYLMKSARVISAEIEQESLLNKIMNVVLESSGAQNGYLIIEENKNLFVRAESHISEKEEVCVLNQSLETAKNICKAIVRYVYRTKEKVILNNACREGAFTDNPEIQAMQLHSILCLPILNQSNLVGILYLENRLFDSVFTLKKIQMTELLTAQAAISLENARLMDASEGLIKKLEENNAELEQFTYLVSHDLKSPLVSIHGFLNLLKKDLSKGNADGINRSLEYISLAANKMNTQLEELLHLARVGSVVNAFEKVSLTTLAHDVLKIVSQQIKERGVQVDISPDLPFVYGDPVKLSKVFQNLVENAIKFMGSQTHPRIEIGVRKEFPDLVFYVRDNGIGINPKYQKKIFDIFDKLDKNTDGSGIGLAIVKRIVALHQGRIWIESEGDGQGKGSTFCFTLMLRKEK